MLPWVFWAFCHSKDSTNRLLYAGFFSIQCKPKLSPYIKATAFGAAAAFVIEQAAECLGLYKIIAWKHIYSFPIFILIYLAADWVSKRRHFERVDNM